MIGWGGPPKAPRSAWVGTGNLLSNRGTVETSREMQLRRSRKKGVQKWKKQCVGSHDNVANASVADVDGVLRGLASSPADDKDSGTGASMFHGNCINMGLNHIGLIKGADDQPAGEEQAAEEKQDDSGNGSRPDGGGAVSDRFEACGLPCCVVGDAWVSQIGCSRIHSQLRGWRTPTPL